MSKLPIQHKFIDLSDYGRPIARVIAERLKETAVTPIHVTITFVVAGMAGLWCMLAGYYWSATICLIIKSILDAADGELARVKQTPSYTGRYLDSIADIVLNAFIFMVLWRITDIRFLYTVIAFLGFQLQGTLYNYYYVILRNRLGGDTTSRVAENHVPKAFAGESQNVVTQLYHLYNALYILFDKTIYWLDPRAAQGKIFPKWFMTSLSTMGLGFQLLVVGFMLGMGWKEMITPFFIGYTGFVILFILWRRVFLS